MELLKTKIFHLHEIATGTDSYYGSLRALVDSNPKDLLGVGIDWLYRHKFDEKPFENEKVKIKKGIFIRSPRNMDK